MRRGGIRTPKPTFGTYFPELPPGMHGDELLRIYNACLGEGLVTKQEKHGSGERTFEIAPTMNSVLDELLYEGDQTSGG